LTKCSIGGGREERENRTSRKDFYLGGGRTGLRGESASEAAVAETSDRHAPRRRAWSKKGTLK